MAQRSKHGRVHHTWDTLDAKLAFAVIACHKELVLIGQEGSMFWA